MRTKVKNFIDKVLNTKVADLGDDDQIAMATITFVVVFLVIYWTILCKIAELVMSYEL